MILKINLYEKIFYYFYESIDEYTMQKEIVDNQFKIYNKKIMEGYSSDDIFIFVIIIKLNALVMMGKCNNSQQIIKQYILIKNYLHSFFLNNSHVNLIKNTAMRK